MVCSGIFIWGRFPRQIWNDKRSFLQASQVETKQAQNVCRSILGHVILRLKADADADLKYWSFSVVKCHLHRKDGCHFYNPKVVQPMSYSMSEVHLLSLSCCFAKKSLIEFFGKDVWLGFPLSQAGALVDLMRSRPWIILSCFCQLIMLSPH